MQQHSPMTFQGTEKPAFPEAEQLRCPRCDSTNTKFCYYNNYNLLQPRHFCKNCRRYWTKGGALRNIPVGGGSRKNTKRSSSSSSSSSQATHGGKQSRSAATPNSPEASQSSAGKEESAEFYAAAEAPPGSFSSLLNGQFGNLMEGLDGDGSGYRAVQSMDTGNSFVGFHQEGDSDSGCWTGGGNGWPDLAMYTPGSSFQQIN